MVPVMRMIKNKKALLIFVVAISFIALGIFSFYFSAGAKNLLVGGTALVIKSWGELFGDSQNNYIASDIDAPSADSSTTSASDTENSSSGELFPAHLSDNVPQNSAATKSSTKKPIAKKNIAPENISSPISVNSTKNLDINGMSANNNTVQNNSSPASALSSDSQNISPTITPPPSCTISSSLNVSRKIILNEIAWMGSLPVSGETSLAVTNREWIELKNISGGIIDLSGWQVADSAGNLKIIFTSSTPVSANGFYLLERGDVSVANIPADRIYSGALSNAGDMLAIFDPTCSASDLLDASFGWPAGNNTTKQTLERDADALGWHTSASPGGTPKAENSIVSTAPIIVGNAGTNQNETTPPASQTSTTNATSSLLIEETSTPTSSLDQATSSNPNATSTVSTASATTTTSTVAGLTINHLVIAAVQIVGASSSNDFIKIYNPLASVVDVSGWKLRKKRAPVPTVPCGHFRTGVLYRRQDILFGRTGRMDSVTLWVRM